MALRDIVSSQPMIISVPAIGGARSIGVQSLDTQIPLKVAVSDYAVAVAMEISVAKRPIARFSRGLFAEQR